MFINIVEICSFQEECDLIKKKCTFSSIEIKFANTLSFFNILLCKFKGCFYRYFGNVSKIIAFMTFMAVKLLKVKFYKAHKYSIFLDFRLYSVIKIYDILEKA